MGASLATGAATGDGRRAANRAAARRWPWLAIGLLASLPHLAALRVPFLFDDWDLIVENPLLRDPHAIRRIFGSNFWAFIGHQAQGSNYYRPLAHLLNFAIYRIVGTQPLWFHAVNLTLHVCVTLLFAALVMRVMRTGRMTVGADSPQRHGEAAEFHREDIGGDARLMGFVAGALFAVHPIHTEVIAWASCAPELLCALFSLLAVYLYVCWRDPEDASSRTKPWAAALLAGMAVCQLLAALSKEVGLLVPVIIAGYELLRRRGVGGPARATEVPRSEGARPRPPTPRQATRTAGPSLGAPLFAAPTRGVCGLERQRVGASLPAFAALGATLAFYAALRIYALGGILPATRATHLSWQQHAWTAAALLYRYLAAVVLPLKLNFFRYYPLTESPFAPEALAGWLSLAGFAALGVWVYRKQSMLALAPLLYLLALLPVFQLPYADTGLLMLERSAYLPSAGFCWLAAAGLIALARTPVGRVTPVLVLALLAAYTVQSAWRIGEWRDELALCRQGVNFAPASFHMHAVYGSSLLRHQRPEEAARELAESTRLKPDYADGHNLLARALSAFGERDRAVAEYQAAAQLAGVQGRGITASRAWNSIAVTYQLGGRLEEAIAAYRASLQFDPDFSAARANLGLALLSLGRIPEAIEELSSAVQADPGLAKAHSNLGLALMMAEQYEQALAELKMAGELAPDDGEVQARLGELRLRRGENDAARTCFQNALRLNPGNRRALLGLITLGVK